MKKFLISAMFILCGFGLVNAQTAPAVKATSKTKVTNSKMAPVSSTKATVKTSTTKETVKTTAPMMKKDGTPDKRFKENKEAKEGPKKKDGTADMRFKANKKK